MSIHEQMFLHEIFALLNLASYIAESLAFHTTYQAINLLNRVIRTTRKTGGLLTGYKPVVLGQRLKALAFTTFKPHSY